MMTFKRSFLALAVALILLLWAVRIHGIGSFPPFIDETIHIHNAEIILRDHTPLYQVDLARQFTVWWLIPFQPAAAAPMWVARVAVLLAALPGAAALLVVARAAGGMWAALLFGIAYSLNAYSAFFERLALADPVAGSAVAVAIAVAYRLKRRVRLRDAVLTGGLLFVAFGAKGSAAPYIGVPLAAAVALVPPGQTWRSSLRDRLRWLGAALITVLGLIAVYVVLMRLRGYDLITNSLSLAISGRGLVDQASIFSLDRIVNNAAVTVNNLSTYFGAIPLILLVLAVLWLIARRRWYLPLCLIAPVIVIWLNSAQEDRYFVTPVALLLLCGAIMLASLTRSNRRLSLTAAAAVLFWAAIYWLPFALTAEADPAALPLSTADAQQYRHSDATGFGFREVDAALRDLNPQQVFGLLSNCQGLRYALPTDFPLECPLVRPGGQDRDALAALLDANRQAGRYAVVEDSPYVPETIPGRVITVIDAGRPRLTIYDLAP